MKLTLSQQKLFKSLCKGMYLMHAVNNKGKYQYKLYKGQMNPVEWVSNGNLNLDFKSLLKADKKGRYTINFNAVRQQDGRTWVKKFYKKNKQNIMSADEDYFKQIEQSRFKKITPPNELRSEKTIYAVDQKKADQIDKILNLEADAFKLSNPGYELTGLVKEPQIKIDGSRMYVLIFKLLKK